MVSILSLLSPWVIFPLLLAIVVIAIVILTIIEKRLDKELYSRKRVAESFYDKKIEEMKDLKTNQEKFLSVLDRTSRQFLAEQFGIDKEQKYSDMIEVFEKQKNKGAVQFCNRMQEAIYSGDSLSQERLDFLLRNFEYFVKYKSQFKGNSTQGRSILSRILGIGKKPPLNDDVVQYLQEGTKRGYDIHKLEEKLIEGGVNIREIHEAVKFVEQEELRMKKENELKQDLIRKDLIKKKEQELRENQENLEKQKAKEISPKIIQVTPYAEKQEVKPHPEIRPFREIKIEVKKTTYPRVEPPAYKYVRSLDDMNRLKSKIAQRKSSFYDDIGEKSKLI